MARVTLKASLAGLQKANAALFHFSGKKVFAELAGVSRTTVQAFFAGKRISPDSFQLICGKLGLPWKEIAGIDAGTPPIAAPESTKAPERQPDVTISPEPIPEICPYKGLSAFMTKDAPLFFGREKFTTDLEKAVKEQPFIAVIGNSGSGKSSVVYAGLIHKLEEQGGWKFITFRPKKDPFVEMVKAMSSLDDKLEDVKEAKKCVKDLQAGDLTLKDVFSYTLERKFPNDKFLIFVDQFEELYTVHTEDKQEKFEDERDIFIDQLLEVVNAESETKPPNIVLVITLRADFYWQAIAYQPLGEIFQKWKPETILEMNQEELQAVIEKPAKKVELKIQDGLINIILDAVKSNPGELPLLEFALDKLWKNRRNNQLTIAAYNEIGGVEKALANHAEEIYQGLSEDDRNRVRHIFVQLVRFGKNTDHTRRLATYSQIGEINWQFVTMLASEKNRLVITGRDESKEQRTVEVIHEALIRGWDRLREWMEEDRDFRKWQERLRDEKDIWENNGKNSSDLLRGALLVQAQDWLNRRDESITDEEERKFILASHQYQEQEDIARIQELLTLSQKELQLKQQLSSLVIAVKASIKLRNIQKPSEKLKKNVIERLQQGSYKISEQNQLQHTREVNGVAFSPDGSMIASVSDDRTIKLWNLSGKLLKVLEGHTGDVLRVSFSPNGQIIASASFDRTVGLWSIEGNLLQTLKGHSDWVWGVSFSPNGQIIASVGADQTVRLWSIEGKPLQTLEGHTGKVYGVSFSPDGQTIASVSFDKTVKLWSIEGKPLETLEGHTDSVWGVDFSPDGQIIASASFDKTVRLWSTEGKLLQTLEGHTDQVWEVSFSPDGQIIASASFDGKVRLWSTEGKLPQTLEGHTNRVFGVNFSPNGQIIASASFDKTVKLWSIEGKPLQTLEGHTDQVWEVSFSPDGQIIASASVDKTVRLWSIEGKPLQTLEGHADQVWGVNFNPDGQIIASASFDKTVRLWSIEGKPLQTLEGHTDKVYGVSFSPDGQIIASASADRTVRLWSIEGKPLQTLEGHTGAIYRVSFSSDGQILASASADRTVRLWSVEGKPLQTLEEHTGAIYRVSFSSDGQILASASADRTVRLWSVEGKPLQTLEGHTDLVYGVSFSPDSRIIASASADKTVRLWHINPDDLILDLDIKLNKLLKKGCNWIRDYLKTNPNVSESDRHLCDDICDEGTEEFGQNVI